METQANTLTWEIPNIRYVDIDGWTHDNFLLSKEFYFNDIDVSGYV